MSVPLRQAAAILGGRTGTATTVTANDAAPTLPAASLAVQFTAVVPIANVDPEGGAHDDETTPTLSDADAE